jgi:hypothetical protein
VDIKAQFFVEIMVEYVMKDMDKGLTVPQWVLIVWTKVPQMPQKQTAKKAGRYKKNLMEMSQLFFYLFIGQVTTEIHVICHEINLLLLLQPWKSIT